MDPPDDYDGDDSPSDGNDSDSHGNDSGFEPAHSTSSAKLLREFRKRKWKEADEVKCLPLPTVPQFRAWKNVLYQNINTASGRPDDKALAWARQAEDESLPDDHFQKVPRIFATLSRKLAAVLQKNATGELGAKLHSKQKISSVKDDLSQD